MPAKLDSFNIGDSVEFILFYSLEGEARPQGTVVNVGRKFLSCKMDRNGKVVRLAPATWGL
jgi:hypothetical protein